jgi:hypothetical protein
MLIRFDQRSSLINLCGCFAVYGVGCVFFTAIKLALFWVFLLVKLRSFAQIAKVAKVVLGSGTFFSVLPFVSAVPDRRTTEFAW